MKKLRPCLDLIKQNLHFLNTQIIAMQSRAGELLLNLLIQKKKKIESHFHLEKKIRQIEAILKCHP